MTDAERQKRLVGASRKGNLKRLVDTISQFESTRDAERAFQRRDAEDKLIINNVLLGGHADLLEYILTHWLDAHLNVRLSLEGQTSLLHQAMCQAVFCAPTPANGSLEQVAELENKNQMSPGINGKKEEADGEEITEAKIIRMIRLLFDAAPKLNPTDVDINRQDRLGRSVVHLAAQHGLLNLTQLLLKPVSEGGFGANQLQSDLTGQRPIHYAAMYRQPHVFKFLLQHLNGEFKENASQASGRLSEQFHTVNQQSLSMTIASYCIVNQSWHCFAELITTIGLKNALEEVVSPDLDQGKAKKPVNYAEETDQM